MNKYLAFSLCGVFSTLVVFGFYSFESRMPFLQHIDLKLKDARFQIRGTRVPPNRIALAVIDNKSIKEIGRWPWSREVFARFIDGLKSYGAKVSVLDIVFSEPQGNRQDMALASAIDNAGQVVMGYFFRNDRQNISAISVEQLAAARVTNLDLPENQATLPITEFSSVDANIPVLAQGAADFGFFNQIADSDGLFRKSPLLLLFDGNIYPSLALKALQQAGFGEISLKAGPEGVQSVAVGNRAIAVNDRGELSLDYYGPSGSFLTFSAADIINKRLPAEALRDKIVFVGATEVGIYDLRATPFDSALPGLDIHATIAANTIEGRFLFNNKNTVRLEIATLILFTLALSLLLAWSPGTALGLVLSSATVSFFLVANYLLFSRFHQNASILYPMMGMLLSTVSAESYRNLVLERKGRYLKKAFCNYVSADLVSEILKNPDSLRLGGEKREITILFSDIRGFTTLSEQLSPEELVGLLNEYLSPMTRIVMDERGTLDKYIGDAVMAIYNAPLNVEAHAAHACRTALKMLEQLKLLNRAYESRGLSSIDIGIGINTGDAIVGNMGADFRFDYTAIGDNVNLASRLEGLNKYYGTHTLVSHATRQQVNDPGLLFREIDLVQVKGKLKPVPLYELMSGGEQITEPFTSALDLYREGRFAEARAAFTPMATAGADPVSILYLERCSEFMSNPPPADWNGVFVARTK